MGSDPVPSMANLFIFYCEDKWTRKTKLKVLIQAEKLSNMFKFIYDLSAINDGGGFKEG